MAHGAWQESKPQRCAGPWRLHRAAARLQTGDSSLPASKLLARSFCTEMRSIDDLRETSTPAAAAVAHSHHLISRTVPRRQPAATNNLAMPLALRQACCAHDFAQEATQAALHKRETDPGVALRVCARPQRSTCSAQGAGKQPTCCTESPGTGRVRRRPGARRGCRPTEKAPDPATADCAARKASGRSNSC